MIDEAWSGLAFHARVSDHLRAQAKRQRLSPAMEDRLLEMLGDRRVKEPSRTMAALYQRGLVCPRLEPVNSLWSKTYFILSDTGVRQAERILADRVEAAL